MPDKSLPLQDSLTKVNDLDECYFTGPSSGDYHSNFRNIRKVLNPVYDIIPKNVSHNLTTGDCVGKWFSNRGAWTQIEFVLPALQDGLFVGILVESNQNLSIRPQPSDLLLGIGALPGQAIKNSTVGESILLRATKRFWSIIRINGTWVAF